MSEMEDKLGAILNNPDMKVKIMSRAQSLGQAQEPPQPKNDPPKQDFVMPELDTATLQKVIGLAQQTGIDRNQQALLKALGPYLSHERINKLEKAMRAAKLANLASSAFSNFSSGR